MRTERYFGEMGSLAFILMPCDVCPGVYWSLDHRCVLESVVESAMQSHLKLLLLQARAWQAARPVRRYEEAGSSSVQIL